MGFAPDALGDGDFLRMVPAQEWQIFVGEPGGGEACADDGFGPGEIVGLVDGGAAIGAIFERRDGFGGEGEEGLGKGLAAPVPAAP